MIDFKVDGFRAESSLKAEGSVHELLADASFLIQSLYANIKKRDAEDADAFKYVLQKMIGDDTNLIWAAEEETND